MTKNDAIAITGGLSVPSKGRGIWRAYSLPTSACITGSKLALIPNSVCARCYAARGRNCMPAVRAAQTRRLESLTHPEWVPAMVRLIQGQPFFRWFDSGDLQGARHFAAIVEVARQTPGTMHWLPTQERGIVRRYRGMIPPNLVVRFSSARIDRLPALRAGELGSTVHTREPIPGTFPCPAPHQKHPVSGESHCGNCRACWDPTIRVISYPEH